MHIKEVDERLDYDAFYTFEHIPGGDLTRAAGRRTWELLHGLADHYPCPPCKGPFQILMSGCHDLVNINLGKPIHDSKRWNQFVEMVLLAEDKRLTTHCVAGRCSK